MMIPRIVISQTSGQIAIEVKQARLELRQDKMQMNVKETPPARVEISNELPKVQIDQTQAFASSGLKTPIVMARDFYNKSYQMGMEHIGAIADEGVKFLRIEQKGQDPVTETAMERSKPVPTLTVVSMPSEGPEISLKEGTVNINFIPKDVKIDWEPIENQLEYIPYEVKITMEQYPSIEIRVEPGVELDLPGKRGVGINVDKAI